MSEEPPRPRAALHNAALAAYLLALIYGSLYPWAGWRSIGVSGLDFLFDPWPRYWTGFDLSVNLLIYAPLGALLVHRLQGTAIRRIAITVLWGSAVSLGLESLQGFLPERVPSRADWLANTGGTLLGALAACRGLRLPRWSRETWQRGSLAGPSRTAGLALLAIWVLVQLHPARPLFGHGDVEFALRGFGLHLRSGQGWELTIEAFVTGAAVVAIGLLVREVWPARAPRVALTVALIGAALLVRGLGAGLQTGLSHALGWLSAGAQGGLVTGAAALSLLAAGRRRARLWAAIGAIAAAAVLTNLFPHDAYGAGTLLQWQRSAWRNFHGLLQAIAVVWPIAAIAWCALRIRALRAHAPLPEEPTR
jgi:VanZ family protein